MIRAKKSMAFFISFIVTLIFVTLTIVLLNPILNKISQPIIKNTILPFILSIGLIFFMLFQGALKLKWNKKIINQSEMLVELKGDIFTNLEKSWLYLFLILIYFSPVIGNLSFKSITMTRIFLFIVFTIAILLLLKFSEKTMKVLFTKKGIVVTGLDLRIDISLGKPLHNATGYYPYSMIDGYLPLENGIELFLEYEQGQIVAIADGNAKNQILGILKANEIEIRKYL